mgnify:CR=1 FL=1
MATKKEGPAAKLKIAVNKKVDHRKGTLKETTAEFVARVVAVKVMTGAPVGQITTEGLFGTGPLLYQ